MYSRYQPWGTNETITFKVSRVCVCVCVCVCVVLREKINDKSLILISCIIRTLLPNHGLFKCHPFR